MLDAADVDSPQTRAHRTSPSGPASIGRWREDLPPELARRSCAVFEEALIGFGYVP
jgi:hypothetical protein